MGNKTSTAFLKFWLCDCHFATWDWAKRHQQGRNRQRRYIDGCSYPLSLISCLYSALTQPSWPGRNWIPDLLSGRGVRYNHRRFEQTLRNCAAEGPSEKLALVVDTREGGLSTKHRQEKRTAKGDNHSIYCSDWTSNTYKTVGTGCC